MANSATLQFWGLGSGLSSIGDMVDAMLIPDQFKLQGYEDKKTTLNSKTSAWEKISSSIDAINDNIKELSGVGKQDFSAVKLSEEGFLTATSTSQALQSDYSIEVKQLAQKHIVSGNKISDISASLNSAGSFSINGVEILVDENDSLKTIMEKINSAKDKDGSSIGVKAQIVDGVLLLESSKTGVANTINIEDTSGLMAHLGLVKDDGSLNSLKEPKNAIVEINGIEVIRESNFIDDAITGVSLNLTKVTEKPINLSVGNDTEKITNMVTTFVDSVNSLFNQLSTLTAYNGDSGNAGILNGDSTARTIKNLFVEALQGSYGGDGEYKYLFEIGIKYGSDGRLILDKTKLTEAIEKNPNAVVNMFTKGLENVNSEANSSNGLFVKMKMLIKNVNGSDENALIKAKTNSIASQIKNYDKLISKQQVYIDVRRAMLEAQFQALETTMNSLSNSSSFIGSVSAANSSSKK